MAQRQATYEASDKILTVPNVISFVRMLLLPVYLILMFNEQPVAAAIVFAVAAFTDFLDGTIARATNSVSKLGQVLDPMVDRLAMLTGIVALAVSQQIPLWITFIVVARDVIFLCGYAYLLEFFKVRIPVIILGKVATTCFFVGIAGLILGFPLCDGLGIVPVSWLPGLNDVSVSWGMWFIYLGFILGATSSVRYIIQAIRAVKSTRVTEG